ncbi:MAG: SPOR domain-containing protein [Sphingobium sp.]|nr:SPOR domain-containing protein [Sphingobium sp.]
MKNRAFSTMLASAVVLGSPMVGCSGASLDHPKLASDTSPALAPRIERALADKDMSGALALAEQMVGAEPQNGDARALLGRAYLANGRYISARTAFNDALTLGNRDPRTIVSLSLAEAGTGDLAGARQLLADHIADLPAGDYGLAMAMAGDTQEGVRALIEASRLPDATAKTRQNLAYALAMGGAWGQARLVAGQDLTAREAEARMAQWSQSFSQAKGAERVVAMIGVAPRTDDAGLPVQFALNAAPKAAEQPVQLASAGDSVPVEAAPAPVAAAAQPAPVKVAAESAKPAFAPSALAAAFAKSPPPRASAPAASSAVNVAATAKLAPAPLARPAVKTGSTSAPVLVAAFNPAPVASKPVAAPSVQAAVRQPAAASGAPKVRTSWTVALAAPVSDGKASDWVVQVGAFDSEAISREKWQRLSKSRRELKAYNVVNSTVAHDGRTFHRLAIRGFESRGAATSACFALKTSGQACFVRLDDTQSTRQARETALAAVQPGGRSRPAR